MKQRPIALWKTGLINSIVVDAHSNTRFVKVLPIQELRMQDRHVTYREIKASVCISSTSIHSILHEHLAVKNICSRLIPQSLKKGSCRVVHRNVGKYDGGASKGVYKIVTWSMIETKQQSLRSKWRPVSSAKLVKWRQFHLSILGRSILSDRPQFVCLKSSQKFENEQEKRNDCSPRQCELLHIGSN